MSKILNPDTLDTQTHNLSKGSTPYDSEKLLANYDALLKIHYKLGQELSCIAEPSESINKFLKYACEIKNGSCGCIYIIDDFIGGLRLTSTKGMSKDFIKKNSWFDFSTIFTRLTLAGEPIYSDRNNDELSAVISKAQKLQDKVFYALLPIINNKKTIGALCLYHHKHGEFSKEEQITLESLAFHIGFNISQDKALKSSAENEKTYRLLLETMNEGFIILDENLMFMYANRKLCEILNYHLNEIIGLPVAYFFNKNSRDIFLKYIANIENNNFNSFEIEWLNEEGETIPTIICPKAIINEAKHITGYYAVITDIQELKQALESLKVKESDLEIKSHEQNEMNTAFKVLMAERNKERMEIEENILLNIKERVAPFLNRLKSTSLEQNQLIYVDAIESSIQDILSTFTRDLTSKSIGLTPIELQISEFIREGKTSKEIADVLKLSIRTIDSHRLNIRKKLGIQNKRVPLNSHLLSLK